MLSGRYRTDLPIRTKAGPVPVMRFSLKVRSVSPSRLARVAGVMRESRTAVLVGVRDGMEGPLLDPQVVQALSLKV